MASRRGTPRPPRSFTLVTCALMGLGSIVAACGDDPTSSVEGEGPSSTSSTTVVPSTAEETVSDSGEALDTPPETTTTTTSAEPTTPGADLGQLLAAPGMRTNWIGSIDTDIEIDLWLAQVGDTVRGEITYASVGEPITILGARVAGEDWYSLQEFGADGRVSGYLTLASVADGIIGEATWGEFDLELTLLDSVDAPAALNPTVREAIYTAEHPPFGDDGDPCCGPVDRLVLSAVTADSVEIQIENVTGGPGYNLAIVDETTLRLDGNRARYELDDAGFDCAFDIVAFDDFVHVTYVDDRFDCGFGNAAGVSGLYLLTEELVPAEDSPFFDAVLQFESFGPVSLGMRWSSLTEELGLPAYDPDLDEVVFGECTYVRFDDDPLSPWLMMLGQGDDWVVSRIEVDDPTVRTAAGVGVGDRRADVIDAYDGSIDARPHAYLGTGAEYLRVTSTTDDRSTTTILFETDEAGVVTTMRNGFIDPIQWIEGCA